MKNTSRFAQLLAKGYSVSVVSTSHLPELQAEIEKHLNQGELDEQLVKKNICSGSDFAAPEELPNAKSLIVVAMHRPPTKATFTWKGKKQSFILPPTYTAYDQERIEVERLVAEAVAKEGFRVATPYLPLKLLATRS